MNIYYRSPKLKSSVEYCCLDQKIFFFSRPGIAIEMSDPSRFIEHVCKLLDGKKDLIELKNCLSTHFPKETPYLETLLTALDNEYLLEDTAENYSEKLTEYDLMRWSKNTEFFASHCKAKQNKYLYQEKLQSTKVAIFGLGGVGSNILYNLAALGVKNFRIIDFDTVELSNLNRQIIYNEKDVGYFKSDLAKDKILQFSPNSKIEAFNKRISSADEIEEIIRDQDFVITAIDYPREKIMDWFNVACIRRNIPFLCGSLDSRQVIYYSIIPKITGCIECWKKSTDKSSFIFQDIIQNENFVPAISPNVAIMPFISIVSGLVSNEFLKIITGIAPPQSPGRLCTYDFITSEITVSESWKQLPDCVICGMD